MTQPAVEPVYGSDYGLQLEGDGVDPSDGTAGTFWLVMLLVGGSDNPYNFDGNGYNGQPSFPLDQILSYDPIAGDWIGALSLIAWVVGGLVFGRGRRLAGAQPCLVASAPTIRPAPEASAAARSRAPRPPGA